MSEVKRAMSEQRRAIAEHKDQFDELRRENTELKAMVAQLLPTPESKKSFFSKI